MATKLAIKDVARVQKLPLSESDRLAKLVPDKIPDKKLNLRNAIEYVPELQAAEASSDPLVRDTIKYAKMLEGNVRGTGVHACGTIICVTISPTGYLSALLMIRKRAKKCLLPSMKVR